MNWGDIRWLFMVFFITPTLCIHKGFTEEHVAAAKKYLSQLNHEIELKQSSWKNPNDAFEIDPDLKLNSVDFHINKRDETESAKGKNNLENYKSQENCFEVCQKEIDKSILKNNMYLGRWLKMLLNRCSELTLDGENKLISFPVSNLDLSKIQEMLNSKSLSIVAIDKIISDMMSEATVSYSGNWISRIVYLLLHNKVFLLMSISIAIFLATLSHPRLFISVIVISVCLIWQWMLLYNKEIAKKQASMEGIHFPDVCQTYKLGFWSTIKYAITGWFVTQGNCEEYYKALMVDPFWEVTPMKVISGVIITFVSYPSEILSEALNTFIIKLFKDLSYTNMIIAVTFLIIWLMMMCNYRVHVPLIFSFEPSYPPIPPSNTGQIQSISNTSYVSSILQGARNIKSFLLSSETAISSTTTDSDSTLPVQESEISEAHSQPIVNNEILKTECSCKRRAFQYSPKTKLEIFGLKEDEKPKKLKLKISPKAEGINVQLTVKENSEINKMKCSQEMFSCPATQSSVLDSNNLQTVLSNIQKQNIKTEVQDMNEVKSVENVNSEFYMEIKNIKTEIKDMNPDVKDIETEVIGNIKTEVIGNIKTEVIGNIKTEVIGNIKTEFYIETENIEAKTKGMNPEVKDIDTDKKYMETDVKDREDEMMDSYVQLTEKEIMDINEANVF